MDDGVPPGTLAAHGAPGIDVDPEVLLEPVAPQALPGHVWLGVIVGVHQEDGPRDGKCRLEGEIDILGGQACLHRDLRVLLPYHVVLVDIPFRLDIDVKIARSQPRDGILAVAIGNSLTPGFAVAGRNTGVRDEPLIKVGHRAGDAGGGHGDLERLSHQFTRVIDFSGRAESHLELRCFLVPLAALDDGYEEIVAAVW